MSEINLKDLENQKNDMIAEKNIQKKNGMRERFMDSMSKYVIQELDKKIKE